MTPRYTVATCAVGGGPHVHMSRIPLVVRRSERDSCNKAAFEALSVLQLCIGTSQRGFGAILGCKTLASVGL